MTSFSKVPKYTIALVAVSGVAWLIAGAVFGGMVAVAYPSTSSLIKAGIGSTNYPASAIHQLAWDQFYINLYAAVIGLFALIIGLTAFRRGETWAWYAILVFVINGLITSLFDYLNWGGWYTVIVSVPAILALLLSRTEFTANRTKLS